MHEKSSVILRPCPYKNRKTAVCISHAAVLFPIFLFLIPVVPHVLHVVIVFKDVDHLFHVVDVFLLFELLKSLDISGFFNFRSFFYWKSVFLQKVEKMFCLS